MLKLVLVLASVLAYSQAFSVRIVNGTDADPGEFPFAAVLRKEGSLTCGSTILNERFILTAAHCACDNSDPLPYKFSIQYGLTTITTDDTNIINVKKVNCNTFDSDLLIWDSAVLELEEPLPADNPNWDRVHLTSSFDTSKEQKGQIIGWGRLWQDGPLPTTLQKLNVDIYNNDLCTNDGFDVKHHICFGAKVGGACNGDSGTALLASTGKQAGIASFITADCGTANKNVPNVYSRVATYYDWIKSVAGDVLD